MIIASFIGFVILRIENVPEGDTRYDSDVDDPDVDDSDLDDMDYDESEEESNSAPHQEERLRALKYVTFILMFSGAGPLCPLRISHRVELLRLVAKVLSAEAFPK